MKKPQNKKVILIGATGLVGSHLLELLAKDEDISNIKLLVRRPFKSDNSKIESIVVDFSDLTSFQSQFENFDMVFCTVGTTQKKVKGDKEAYKKVDYDIPVHAAKFAEKAGCSHFVFVSSLGANSNSGNFYLKLKGDVEDAIKDLTIPSILAFRPSFLMGNRKEYRFGERLGISLAKPLSFAFPSKMKPVKAIDVAKAMLNSTKNNYKGFHVFHFREIQRLCNN